MSDFRIKCTKIDSDWGCTPRRRIRGRQRNGKERMGSGREGRLLLPLQL